jgi:hypothetical protein
MSGSTQTHTFEVEALLKSYGEALAARRLREALPQPAATFDSRPYVAAFLAFLIFAPGCAAAAVFLMKSDGNVPPFVAPDDNAPLVAKSDRLPLNTWGLEAAKGAETRLIARLALADPAFLVPMSIRGSLEDAVATVPVVAAEMPETILSAPRSRARREVRRIAPTKLVAEVVQPEPPPPSLLEKLFGLRPL